MARRAGRVLGRGRHGGGRPRPGGHPGAVRRRPVQEIVDEAVAARRRPAGHPPPALSARYDHGRGRSLQGPRRAHADQNDIALHVAHTTPTPPTGCLRRPRRRPRPAGRTPLVPDPRKARTAAAALGRVAELDHPVTVRELAARVARRLPATAQGIRWPGDPRGRGPHGRRQRRLRRQLSSTRSARPASTPSSPPTCATTRRPRRWPTVPLALLDAAHWATEWPGASAGREPARQRSPTATAGTSASMCPRHGHRPPGPPTRRPPPSLANRSPQLNAAPADQIRTPRRPGPSTSACSSSRTSGGPCPSTPRSSR